MDPLAFSLSLLRRLVDFSMVSVLNIITIISMNKPLMAVLMTIFLQSISLTSYNWKQVTFHLTAYFNKEIVIID